MLTEVAGREGLWDTAALALWDPAAEFQPQPNTLYAVDRFVKSTGIVSALISWQMDSLWDHVEPLGRDGQCWTGAHAGTGVQARPLDWLKPHEIIFERRYARPVSASQFEKRHEFIEAKIGLPYNYRDVVGLAIHKRIGISNHALICSAFDLEVQWATGFQFMNVAEGFENLVTPETLHQSLDLFGHCIYSFSSER